MSIPPLSLPIPNCLHGCFASNYCNLHDLYCKASGCHVQRHQLNFFEEINPATCPQHDVLQCLKT